jgi:hypothetical protein
MRVANSVSVQDHVAHDQDSRAAKMADNTREFPVVRRFDREVVHGSDLIGRVVRWIAVRVVSDAIDGPRRATRLQPRIARREG